MKLFFFFWLIYYTTFFETSWMNTDWTKSVFSKHSTSTILEHLNRATGIHKHLNTSRSWLPQLYSFLTYFLMFFFQKLAMYTCIIKCKNTISVWVTGKGSNSINKKRSNLSFQFANWKLPPHNTEFMNSLWNVFRITPSKWANMKG